MSVSQQFCLRWNNHQRTLISVFDSLLESGTLVDCTLAAEGRYLKAHKVVLSACSPYLGVLLSQHQEKHPILILKDIKFQELKSMLDYMYRGEVNISQEELGTFLKAAESLQIKGLTESAGIGVRDNSDFEDPVSKRFDHRKQPPSLSSVSSNSPTIWSQNESVRTYSRPREGSLSPTSKKRKLQRTNGSDDHHPDNGDDSMTESEPQGLEKSPTNNNNNIPSSVSKVIKAEPYRKSCSPDKEVLKPTENTIIKPKVESISGDRQECLTEMSYDDSVEDMALEEEEEEFDENELSQPGTSQGDTNHTAPQTNSWQLDTTNQDSTSTVNTPMDCKDSDLLAEKFECKLCGKVYQWKQSLKRHIREDRCDKGPQHACPRCGMSFKHTSRLNKHVILCPHILFDESPSSSASTSSTSTVQRILKLPPPCPDALPITAVTTSTTATSSPSQTILVLHLKNQSLAQNWNSKIQKLGN
ncbi:longitudinals lacking protein, isoforms F/I/K/T isoform X4 [Acyrthosiphon pisum]|uniref:Longitudinals lacking protein n=1 Tax=Acyrthosiphon pisum TaxID=7029 RepID=A0A8R2D5I6_ACYPI|nr:longitudinals lacking protein, isoforms F/I/K/T isoform X4 [Acyrthosiphon pisum]|eukprot:XP_016661083.1 PREDICTED: longitudinals lacking protein, isoforms F/I/K/T isoform X4 [Acyrthosiphon pisum]